MVKTTNVNQFHRYFYYRRAMTGCDLPRHYFVNATQPTWASMEQRLPSSMGKTRYLFYTTEIGKNFYLLSLMITVLLFLNWTQICVTFYELSIYVRVDIKTFALFLDDEIVQIF